MRIGCGFCTEPDVQEKQSIDKQEKKTGYPIYRISTSSTDNVSRLGRIYIG